MGERYYIRVRGRKQGPLSVEQLHSLGRRGRFGRHFEVSTDGKRWEPATSFPELFSDGLDDEFDPLDDEEGLGPPLDDPSSRAADPQEARRTPKGRRRRGEPRDLRESIPLADDVDEPILLDDDEVAREAESEPRPRRNRQTHESVNLHTPLWERADEEATTKRKRSKRAKKKKQEQPESDAPLVSDVIPESDDEKPEERKESKSGGFFGLFRRKDETEEQLSPHLQTLHEMSNRLQKEAFGLEEITLIGSRRQELPVGGHQDSGDGIQTLALMTMIAYQTRSTDIHLEPQEDGYDVRMRIDGMLVPIVHLPREVAARVGGVIKVLCDIDFSGKLGIQEGSYSTSAPSRRTDYRVSFTPSVHGQKLAIRVLDVANSPQSIDGLGAPKQLIRKLQQVMQQNSGMILMCGPTGSGKTTTLYSLIRGIDRKSRNVMTIEDPVEYQIEGVTQSSVDAERGKDFSDMLRALLRQDPDVLLLGEIRDAESAKIAMQATMTGHLVLSTVHAQDTVNTVFRLLDLGADPNMVASALNLVLAQRLVRVLCTHCRKRRRPDSEELQRMGRNAREMIYEAKGCARCLGTGYSGRRALFELMENNSELKETMLQSPTLRQLKAAAEGHGFVTLHQHGHQLVAQGVTTFDEIDRVAGLGH